MLFRSPELAEELLAMQDELLKDEEPEDEIEQETPEDQPAETPEDDTQEIGG